MLFPALVGIMTTVKAGVDNKRDALIAVKSPYETLLSQIVVDIAENNYAGQKETHRGTWQKLDALLVSAKIEM